MSRDSPVAVATGWTAGVRIPARVSLCLLHNVQIGWPSPV
jgi:hypothetical protein